ncbi:S-adenosyl-L-methionine-dependent methyltransferase [Tothia fuscella]|uniref:S-adenosyl-L-methionine-dependent methyltransferase n=1 Tax=Tothia fuscella TaxID=1048955 RepID=A0A9P4P1D2_9PEZI|nr:S-adenosyl-L-methionine-dependent methyltransferase [Tothia fuscella]
MAGSQQLAHEAVAGFAKGELYDQYRPSYPPEAVQTFLEALNVAGVDNNEKVILDLGAGTGKFTELLAAREENFKVIAVEPHGGMRQELAKKALPGVTIKDGLASSIPLQDGSIDAVVAAQSFHWFADLDSLKEIHRVLKPDGTLGMIWNVEDYNQCRDHKSTTTWESKLQDMVWAQPYDKPRFRHGKWRDVFEDQVKSTPFSILSSADPLFTLPLGEQEFKWTVRLKREEIWKRFRTLGQIAVLEGEKLDEVKTRFELFISNEEEEETGEGAIPLHGVTFLAWTSKVPDYVPPP